MRRRSRRPKCRTSVPLPPRTVILNSHGRWVALERTKLAARVSLLAIACALVVVSTAGFTQDSPDRSTRSSELEITGQLLHPDGSPASGIHVDLLPYPDSYLRRLHELTHDSLPSPTRTTTTGDDGRFHLVAPEPGTWRLLIEPEASQGQAAAPIRVDLVAQFDSISIAPITLPRWHTLTVEVLDPDGRRVANALVLAQPKNQRLTNQGLTNRRRGRAAPTPLISRIAAHTADNGRAAFRVPSSGVKLWITADGFFLHAEEASAGKVDVRLERGPMTTIEVRDPTGARIPDAILRAGSDQIALARTDEQGRARVGTVARGAMSYQAETSDGGYGSVQVPATTLGSGSTQQPTADASTPHVLVTEPAPTLSGRVVDIDTGNPISGAFVWSPHRFGDYGSSDPSGRFTLTTWSRDNGVDANLRAPGYRIQNLRASLEDIARGEQPTVALIPERVLRGKVVDKDGRAVPDARLIASTEDPMRAQSASWSMANSDSVGHFVVENLARETPYQLLVEAGGFAPKRVNIPAEQGPLVADLEIVLARGAGVSGALVDRDDLPVSGAKVILRPDLSPTAGGQLQRPGDPILGVSDAHGRFLLEGVPPGRYDVSASGRGFAPADFPGIEVPAEEGFDLGTLTLLPGAEIEGRVTDSTGAAVSGAAIQAFTAPNLRRMSGATPAGDPATSDRDGRFTIDSLPQDQLVDLVTTAEGFATHESLGHRTPTEQPVVIALSPGSTVHGRVIDDGGRGLGSAHVQVGPDYARRAAPMLQAGRNATTQSDEEGRFRLDHVANGFWTIRAWIDRSSFGTAKLYIDEAGDQEVEIRIETAIEITGWVTGTEGQPVPGVEITVASQEGGSSSTARLGITDGSGRYRGFGGKFEGRNSVVANHPDFARSEVEVELRRGSNRVDLRLEPGWQIRGRVIDSDGAPAANARIAATAQRYSLLRQERSAIADPSGFFVLKGIADGSYSLIARKEGYAPTRTDAEIEVRGGSVDGVELVLDPGATIRGLVRGIAPGDAPQISVSFASLDGATLQGWRPSVGVDADGRFRGEFLPFGEYLVTATLGSQSRQSSARVLVSADQREAFVELDFEHGLILRGTLTRQGQPISGALMFVVAEGSSSANQVRTDRGGAFRIEGLTEGLVTLVIRQPDGGRRTRLVDLRADLEIAIDLEAAAVLEGVVLDRASGEPVALAQIAAIGGEHSSLAAAYASSQVGGTTSSGPDGSFRLEVEPGRWRLQTTADGYSLGTLPIEAVAGDERGGLRIFLEPAAKLTLLINAGGRAGLTVPQFVTVQQIGPDGQVAGMGFAQPGPDGSAEVSFLQPGTWRIYVRSQSSPPVPLTVTVPGDPVPVTLPPGGQIDLRVPALESSTIPARVAALLPSGEPWLDPLLAGNGWPMVQGRARIGPLPAGAWTLAIQADDGQTWSAAAIVTADQVSRLVIE